ncbi:hypothetical protein [Pseudoalteromonas sp. S16_S37]|uniref:hypothetical protein n=1 Tax=Pseudoalteromonas sp. S16_S37 TaxID=2720228 RepID=UPI00168111D1|nr:hypothetical protein [Pseudoalteromonas sp. S16_S37]MBD1582118.1 hypothetical protein [Pseudoalteromonas sp. S16_S37]
MDIYEFFTLVQTILALKNEGGTTNEDLEAQLLSSLQQGSDIKKRLDIARSK